MRIVQNNSGLWCQRKTTQFHLENENSEPQMWDKHGHVGMSAVIVILNLFPHLSINKRNVKACLTVWTEPRRLPVN